MSTNLGKDWLKTLNENPQAIFYYSEDKEGLIRNVVGISISIFKDNRKNNIYALYTLNSYTKENDYFDPQEHNMSFVGYYSSELKKMFNLLPAFTIPCHYLNKKDLLNEFSYEFSIGGIIKEIEAILEQKFYDNFSNLISSNLPKEFKNMTDLGNHYLKLASMYNVVMKDIEEEKGKEELTDGLRFVKNMENIDMFQGNFLLAINEKASIENFFHYSYSFIVRNKKDAYDIFTNFIKEFCEYNNEFYSFEEAKKIATHKIAQNIFENYFSTININCSFGEEFKIKSQYQDFFKIVFVISFIKDYCACIQKFDYDSINKYVFNIYQALNNSDGWKTVEILLEKGNESKIIKVDAAKLIGREYISWYDIAGFYKDEKLKYFTEDFNEIPLKYIKTISFRKKVYYKK